TYFPPEARWGRPGFPQVLEALARAYREDREAVAKNVAALTQALGRLATPTAGDGVSIELTDRVAERLTREIDWTHGGIGDAPKFPAGEPALGALARLSPHRHRGDAQRRDIDARSHLPRRHL